MDSKIQFSYSQNPAYFRLLGYLDALGRVFNSADYVCWFDAWLLHADGDQKLDGREMLRAVCPQTLPDDERWSELNQIEARVAVERLLKLPIGDPAHEKHYPNHQVNNALAGLWERINDCFYFNSARHLSYEARGNEELHDYALEGFTLVSVAPDRKRTLILHGGASGRARSDKHVIPSPLMVAKALFPDDEDDQKSE